MSKKLPVVAIVGRANVGKSSLFNRMIGRQQQVVAREAGTTRDSIYSQVEFGEHHFWLVDTAGLKPAEDEFEASIQDQIEEATQAADVILVVVEAATQITEEDRRVAKKALKSQKPVILITNKVDQVGKGSDTQWERLGIKQIFKTSATQSIGVKDLLIHLTKVLPIKQAIEDDVVRIALLGRPNVGKSYLFNTLAKKQQAIVANVAGTTRDVNRVRVRYENHEFEILDTAGIRRPGKIEKGIEKFSVLRSLQAIEEADVCLLLMDVNELNTSLDQKIAGLIKEAGKGLVIVVSKWDEAEDKDAYTRDALAPQIAHSFKFAPWAPLIFTSAVTGKNVAKLFELSLSIYDRRKQMLKTADLNKVLSQALISHPPAGLKSRHPKPRYIVQDDVSPPTFRLYGAHLEYLHWSWKRYLEKLLRETADFSGTPIKMYMMNNARKSGKTKKYLPKIVKE
jgi:GTP-binding protein